jgi:hypothetical protein
LNRFEDEAAVYHDCSLLTRNLSARYAEDGKTPIDHVRFSGKGGGVYKGVAWALKKRAL